ncbi:MAG: hypothetical protein HC831_08050 [Chloroflexia bacterium]|nr:hypothetical protein [Chloroflexia bacterium]
MENQGRGQLTDRIKEKSRELLGYEISVGELRLLAYLQYELVNSKNPNNVNSEEKEMLASWRKKGFILDGITEGGRVMTSRDSKFKVSKDFWNAIVEILWLGYVDID